MMTKNCGCDGFIDRWDSKREEHYTDTIHEEDCKNHPERRAEDYADHLRQLEKDGEL